MAQKRTFSSQKVAPRRGSSSVLQRFPALTWSHVRLHTDASRETFLVDPLIVHRIHLVKVLIIVRNEDRHRQQVASRHAGFLENRIEFLERLGGLLGRGTAGNLAKVPHQSLYANHTIVLHPFTHAPRLAPRSANNRSGLVADTALSFLLLLAQEQRCRCDERSSHETDRKCACRFVHGPNL